MNADQYMELVKKQAAGQSMERAILKSAEKNMDATLTSERVFMQDVKNQSLSILQNLRQFMQKKADKDW